MIDSPAGTALPQPPRSPLRKASYIHEKYFKGIRSREWVLEHVRPRVKLGPSTVLFYEEDVEAFIARHREEAAA